MLFALKSAMKSQAAWLLAPAFVLALTVAAPAAQRMASLLPAETVGYVAIDNTPDFLQRWSATQIGRLTEDPTMRPFVEQIEERFNRRFGGIEERLGVTVEDFRAAASGEAALAIVKTGEPKQPGRVVALIDSEGREVEAAALLGKIDARLLERGAKKRQAGAITLYDLPAEPKNKLPARTAAVFHVAGRLAAIEGERLATRMLARVEGGGAGASLADKAAFQNTQDRARKASRGETTSLGWFLSPFEYEAATREPLAEGELPDKKDTLAILAEQGFDAITGIGGLVSVAPRGDRDFIHHTYIYAPPKPGTEGKPAEEKYRLAMRMLELPNNNAPLSVDQPPVELWAPRQVATYKTWHLDLQNVFQHMGSLFDALYAYEGAFANTLESWERDYYGPKVRVQDEVVPFLGKRVVVMTDYTLPIDPECERYLIAIDVTDEDRLRDPVNRWLKNEPGAEKKSLQGVEYWELGPEDEALTLDEIDPLAPLDEEPAARPDREERVLRKAAVCLHQGRLVIGSDADFLRQALFGVSPGESLSSSPDLRAAIAALSEIAPGKRCAWTFSRNDEAFRPTYELIREGRMPEAQTFFGRLLNRLLTSDEEREVDALREQKIDGSRLPSFELARRYFGPSARSVRSEQDGWLISGVVLSKEPTRGVGGPVARK